MSLTLITAPTSEPVTLAEVKAYAQVDVPDDDSLLTALIVAARELVESDLQRQLMTAVWEERFDAFPSGSELRLSLPPLQSVTWVKYVDSDGVTQTLDSATYTVDTYSEPGRILLNYSESWPVTRDERDAVTVRMVNGYPNTGTQLVPEGIKTSIKSLVKLWFDNPNPVMTSGAQPKPIVMHVQALLDSHRNYDGYV